MRTTSLALFATAAVLASVGWGGCGGDSGADPDADVGADTVVATDTAVTDAAVTDTAVTDTSADTAVADTSADTATSPGCPVAPHAPSGASLSGTGRYRTLAGLDVSGLPPRDITILLPADYDTATARRYPVVYMHDGQNLFFAETSFAGEWGVDETIETLVGAGAMEPVIVVGLHNTSERIADYTPTADAGYGGGNGAAYVAWLADVVKPAVDALLRTRCERDATGVMGSSLGGLISLYAALERPEVFGRIGVVSPSLWWDDEDMVGRVDAYQGALPARLWLDMGTAEGGDANGDLTESVALLRAVRDRALARGMVLGADLGYYEAVGAAHNESAWRQRLPAILRYLYGATPLEAPTTLTLALFSSQLSLAGRAHTSAIVSTRHGSYGRLTAPNAAVSFAVSGDAVSVDADGGVAAVAAGEAAITASYSGLTATATATVAGGADLAWVTFDVTVPAATPGDATVYVVGSVPALGDWAPGAVPLEFSEDTGRWKVSLQLPAGATFEYKYTRGSWATVEANASGGDVSNRQGGPAQAGTITDAVARWIDQ